MILKFLTRHRDKIILAAIIALGLGLRIWALFQSGSLWFDEVVAADIAKQPIVEIWSLLKIENNPPLYFLLLHWWGGIFSFSDQAVRALSILVSTAAIPAIYYLAKALTNKTAAFLSALVLAVTPYAIFLGVEARMYSLLLVFSILSLLYFWRWLESNRRIYLFLYLFFTLAALYTHLTAVTIIAVQGIYLLAFKENRKKIKYFILHLLALVLAFSPWLYGFFIEKFSLAGNGTLSHGWYFAKMTNFPVIFYQPVMVFFYNSFSILGQINFLLTSYYLLVWLIVGLAIFFWLFKYLANKSSVTELKSFIYIALMAFLPGLGSSLTFNITNYRYYSTSIIGLYILFAVGLGIILASKTRLKLLKFTALFLTFFMFYVGVNFSKYNDGAIKNVAQYIESHNVSKIVAGPSGYSLLYYLPEQYQQRFIMLNRFQEKAPKNLSRLAYLLKYNWNWDQWARLEAGELANIQKQIKQISDSGIDDFSFLSQNNLINDGIMKFILKEDYCGIDIYQPKTTEVLYLIHFVKNKNDSCPETLMVQ